MKAVKANKEYNVTEDNKAFYVAQGFDIMDDAGEVILHGKGKTVDYADYQKLREAHVDLMKKYEKLQTDHAALMEEHEKLLKETEGKGKTAKKAGE